MTMRILPLLFLISILNAQTEPDSQLVRGDAKLEFLWRAGYQWYDDLPRTKIELEDAARSTPRWYDAHYRSHSYRWWDGRNVVGPHLDYNLSTPVSRAIRCTSDVVPVARAGRPVTFAIPIQYVIGTEPQLSFALKIVGQGEDLLAFTLTPRREITMSSGQVKATFYAHDVTPAAQVGTSIAVAGMLHVRVYPRLLNYGGRMTFEFHSRVSSMDVASSIVIGSLWEDLSQSDVRAAWKNSKLSDEEFARADRAHRLKVDEWSRDSLAAADAVRAPGRIEISASATPRPYDRGEGRVQAYPGNPLKDIPYGDLTHRMTAMARNVTDAMGKRLSLFRYQTADFLWRLDNPARLNDPELPMFEQWMHAANASADETWLVLQLGPFAKAYIEFTHKGVLPLPESGVPGFSWDQLQRGYVTALRYAQQQSPRLRIIQMPYEFDNISPSEVHRDAHYRLFQMVYRAVNEVNRDLPAKDHLRVAGLGVNNPNWPGRWDFIDGFLKRFAADNDPAKRLDYLTWHTYAYSTRDVPSQPKGFGARLRSLLAKHGLPLDLPVWVDEMGVAEGSTIESLSDMVGAVRKEAAMACYTAALDHWYREEGPQFKANSGAGWHFSLLTYGLQNVLSPYAKGMVLRSKLPDGYLPSSVGPRDDRGYGVYSLASRDEKRLYALIWSVSPGLFHNDVAPVHYPATQVVFSDLPASMTKGPLKVTIQSSEWDSPAIQKILNSDRFHTLPLSRGGDRYNLNFTDEESRGLNAIPSQTLTLTPKQNRLTLSVDVREYGMYLITVEP